MQKKLLILKYQNIMKKKFTTFLLGIISLLLMSFASLAQSYNIKGKITDSESQPMIGATVILKGTTFGTAAIANGTYSFTAKTKAGSYDLEFRSVGYSTVTKKIVLGSSNDLNINVTITESKDGINLDEIVVTGSTLKTNRRELGSGMDKFFGCIGYVMELRKKIIKESGLGISYALATNKLISKVATNEHKPNGQVEIKPGREKSFLAPLPIEKVPMIGNQTATLLRRMGVETISTLSQIPVEMMINLLGKNGIELWRRAQGIDDTPIVPYHEQKSIGTENTFDTDTIDTHFLHKELARMTERTAFELRCNNKLTGCITVKMRYSDFQTMTMQSTISYTANDHILMQKARELFNKLYDRRLLVRLVGVRFTHLVSGSYQINIFEDSREIISLHQAIDSVKKQFGEHLLSSGACI